MSKHIDLLAVAVLLLAATCTTRWHEMARTNLGQARWIKARIVNPVFKTSPRLPAVPCPPRLPQVRY